MRRTDTTAGAGRRVGGHQGGMDCRRFEAAGRSRRRAVGNHVARVLPARRHDRSAHRRRGGELRDRVRAGVAGELERPLPVPGRRRLERIRADRRSAASAAGGSPALARGFAVVSTDTGHRGAADSTPASCRISRRASISRTRPSAVWPRSPSGSSPSTTASRPIVRTSPAVPPADARRC